MAFSSMTRSYCYTCWILDIKEQILYKKIIKLLTGDNNKSCFQSDRLVLKLSHNPSHWTPQGLETCIL